jgi:hypothetical protein
MVRSAWRVALVYGLAVRSAPCYAQAQAPSPEAGERVPNGLSLEVTRRWYLVAGGLPPLWLLPRSRGDGSVRRACGDSVDRS